MLLALDGGVRETNDVGPHHFHSANPGDPSRLQPVSCFFSGGLRLVAARFSLQALLVGGRLTLQKGERFAGKVQ